jgi:hypothetical protein
MDALDMVVAVGTTSPAAVDDIQKMGCAGNAICTIFLLLDPSLLVVQAAASGGGGGVAAVVVVVVVCQDSIKYYRIP